MYVMNISPLPVPPLSVCVSLPVSLSLSFSLSLLFPFTFAEAYLNRSVIVQKIKPTITTWDLKILKLYLCTHLHVPPMATV